MGLLVLTMAILGAIGWVTKKAAGDSNDNRSEWRCPHGYDCYACSKGCPLYEQCLGTGEEAFIPNIEPDNEKYNYDTLPSGGNEDGDFRTVYMDDERYDEREEDEMYDDDRNENGW